MAVVSISEKKNLYEVLPSHANTVCLLNVFKVLTIVKTTSERIGAYFFNTEVQSCSLSRCGSAENMKSQKS